MITTHLRKRQRRLSPDNQRRTPSPGTDRTNVDPATVRRGLKNRKKTLALLKISN